MKNIVIFGAGAVGATVGGWLSSVHDTVWLVDLPPVAQALAARGLTLYEMDRSRARTIPVKAISDLAEAPPPDVVILCVKTYSLDKVCALVKAKTGDRPLILALQNGVDNQSIVPKHFSRAIYGIVAYNAWLDEPGVVGYQKHGPLVLGSLDPRLDDDARALAALLDRGVPTTVTERFQDAAHSKMIINLTNSLQALIGHPQRPITNRALFQKVLTNLTYEGVKIVRAAGYRECRLGGMPSWALMTAAARLPPLLTRPAFEKNVKKMVMSSMAQDVLLHGGADSELETLNGYFVRLASRFHVTAPYNCAVYAACKERFGKPGFTPMSIEEVHAMVSA
jgi:2-dehydropantoate 2-reductase